MDAEVDFIQDEADGQQVSRLVVRGVPVESRTDDELWYNDGSPVINTMFTAHYEALLWWTGGLD